MAKILGAYWQEDFGGWILARENLDGCISSTSVPSPPVLLTS